MSEKFPVECGRCNGTGFSNVGWLPSGGLCPACGGKGHTMQADNNTAETQPTSAAGDVVRDALAQAMCAVELRSKAASLDEVAAGIPRWTRHRYEAERLISELRDYGLEVCSPTPPAEKEWEYALIAQGDTEPYSDISEDLDWLAETGDMGVSDYAVRRRKAGPWEPVEAADRVLGS